MSKNKISRGIFVLNFC